MATRLARHGAAWIRLEANDWRYQRINLVSAKYSSDQGSLDPHCDCQLCTSKYSKAYLSHLLRIKDPTAGLLLSIHNIAFLTRLTESIRESIVAGRFSIEFPAGRALRQE
jgi:queuine tRNA-ribosyltransferase